MERAEEMAERLIAKNRKASFQYELVDTYTAGMVLTGTEIKSLRMGHASLVDAYCLFIRGELWVRSLHIPEYSLGTFYNHEVRRDRKLLLNARELVKLQRGVNAKGNTIVAVRLFINERGYAKLVIALARGKQQHDKRETIKKRDNDREIQRYRRHDN
jgi:ssrA-binding protein